MLSTQPVVASVPSPAVSADIWSTSPLPLTPPGRAERRPCAPAPAKPPPEIAGSEPPVAPPAWEPNKGPLEAANPAPQRPPGILLPMTDEEKQRKAVVEKAKAQGIPLKVRLPDAALGVVRPLLPGCPAKKRLPWPELMEDSVGTANISVLEALQKARCQSVHRNTQQARQSAPATSSRLRHRWCRCRLSTVFQWWLPDRLVSHERLTNLRRDG
eukprot:s1255_g29.t1